MAKKFYILPQHIKNNKIYLPAQDAHHITNVLRYKLNETIVFFDNSGKEYISKVKDISIKGLMAEVVEIKDAIPNQKIEITLAQAMPKLNKFDLIIQKAVELGVDKVIPLETERSIVKLELERQEKKIARWQKIAQEASQQCGRNNIPEITTPKSLNSILNLIKNYDLSLFFCLDDKTKPLKEILKSYPNPKKVLIFIGPEGDFSPEEISLAREKKAIMAGLGHLVLKVETAAISVLSILNYEYN